MDEYSVKFVAKKISKIRWRPKLDPKGPQSRTFATGSWDDQNNCIALWQILDRPIASENGDAESLLVHEPQKVFETSHVGDIMDLKYVNHDLMAVASSTGSVSLLKHRSNTEAVTPVCAWDKLHQFQFGGSAPCTCLATHNEWIASGGEDGRAVLLAIDQQAPLQTLDKVDSCAINDLSFLKQSEIITVNSFGQLKTFDLRQDTSRESQILSVTETHTPLLCVARHPGQPHIVATGGYDGMLTICDLRQERFHMTRMEAHTGPVWEVKFHPVHPNHLFTCSDDGSLWHWDSTDCATDPVQSFMPSKGKCRPPMFPYFTVGIRVLISSLL
ncbi:nucleoporin Nup43 [Elysia marginata]|uniref:Nucleoporin Nup43 n=1 Tax=Elysia marginata TaxID=1093978 RepID=A0AAV4JZ36_9GAST|nr:nucleoporin Nup43 [Elysia marginata]